MSYSVGELVEMARALSEGDFEKEFRASFQGELGQLAGYLDAVRQTLKTIFAATGSTSYLIPEAASGVAEIYQHAENGVNSILDVVDRMSADQQQASALLEKCGEQAFAPADIDKLKQITEDTRRGLMALIGYLSFQDVLRQRVEKVQGVIEDLEKRTLELLVKFRVQKHGHDAKGEEEQETLRQEVRELSGEMGLDQSLVDELLAGLK